MLLEYKVCKRVVGQGSIGYLQASGVEYSGWMTENELPDLAVCDNLFNGSLRISNLPLAR